MPYQPTSDEQRAPYAVSALGNAGRRSDLLASLPAVWRYMQWTLIPLVLFYGVPFYVFSKLLLRLTNGALWFPPDWRISIEGLVLGIGACVFALTRSQGKNEEPSPAAPARGLRWRWKRIPAKDRFRILGAFGLLAALMLLAEQFEMRHRFIYLHDRPLGAAARVFLNDERNPEEIALDQGLVGRFDNLDLPEGQYLEAGPEGVRLRLILPPRAWMPPEFGNLLDEWQRESPEAALEYGMNEELSRLLAALNSEPQARSATSSVIRWFLVIHILIIVAASAGYGWIHAFIGQLREKGVKVLSEAVAKLDT